MIETIEGTPTGYTTYIDYVASGSDPTKFWINQSTGLFVPANEFQINDNVGSVTNPGLINEFDEALLNRLSQGWIRVNDCCIDYHGLLSESSKAALNGYHAAHPEFKTLTYYDAATGQYLNKIGVKQETVRVVPTVVHDIETDGDDTEWPLAVDTPYGM